MNNESVVARLGVAGKALAVLCLTTFWAVPFSPFVAIAAVTATRRSSGWPRFLAKAGAVLCILCTLMLGAMLYLILFVIFGNYLCDGGKNFLFVKKADTSAFTV